MGVQERRAREKKELRQEILDAARAMFVHEGFENVSMRKIAEKIEYSPTTIYLYFKDKADLLDCICEETFARLVRKQNAIDQAVTDPIERLKKNMRAYIEFGLKYPNHYKVAFLMTEDFEERLQCERSREMGKKAYLHLRNELGCCASLGLIQVADIEASAQVIWANIHGLTSLLITHPRFPWLDRNLLIDTQIENTLAGLQVKQPAIAN
ncbi:MAG: TetR/AcrR family transcriptional regulator [Bryobacteraceae bacterium]